MAKKLEAKEIKEAVEVGQVKAPTGELVAYADFDYKLGFDTITVRAGEVFNPPANWKRNLEQEELLLASQKKNDAQVGIVFTYLGDFVNPGEKNQALRERRVHNAILPLEVR